MESAEARPGSFCEPTMAKKMSVDSTSKLPPSTSGLPKSARLSTKPIRKALARPGRIRGQVTVLKVRQRSARKRLRRLFHRRADAVDDADQHEIGNGRKGERLHQQQSEEAIDPAARRDAEKLAHQPGRHAVAAEEKDDAEADDERRGDDRQYGEQAQQALGAEVGALVQQREAQAQQGGGEADGNRQDEAVPGHAPNIGREQPAGESRRANSRRPATRPLR